MSLLRCFLSLCLFALTVLPAVAAPEIAVQQPAGTNRTDGATTITFPQQIVGIGSRDRVFTVRNTGPDPLTGLTIQIDGTNPGDFTNTTLPASLSTNTSATFTVTFSPAATGARSAALHILSNDTDEASFDINLAGEGMAVDAIAEAAYLKPGATGEFEQFGLSVAISGNTAVIGSPQEDSDATGINGNETNDNSLDSGAVYVFVRGGDGRWARQAYLKASNTGADDRFGCSVAIEGDTLVVGANRESSNATTVNGNEADNSQSMAGAAYVFTRMAGVWTQQAYLKAHNASELDLFGCSVAISGNCVVVGAQTEGGEIGAAYVFRRNAGVWSQEKFLKASNPGGDLYGLSVGISGDTIVVGAPKESSSATGVNGDETINSAFDAGAAYVYRYTAGDWVKAAYLKASNTAGGDQFGYAVAISGDTVVVGAFQEDSNGTGGQTNNAASAAGAAYVFTRSAGNWSQQAYLKASNAGAGDQFGYDVAIDGDLILVGAFTEASNAPGVGGNQTNNSAGSAGAVYSFTRTAGVWSQQAYLKGPSPATSEFFHTVALSGRTAVIGSFGEGSNATGINGDDSNTAVFQAGAAHIFNNLGFPLPATFTTVSIASDNATGSAYAKEGDTITLSFMASDPLDGLPVVTLAGRTAVVSDLGGNAYEATLVVNGTDTEGPVSILISAEDLPGNTVTAAATSDSSSVTLDRTNPVISLVSIVSDNSDPEQALIGDTVTLSFTVNEDLFEEPSVLLAGRAAPVTAGSGGAYTATITVEAADPSGEIGFEIAVKDLAGNMSNATSTTDSSSVEIVLPEIVVEEPAGTDIADDDSRAFGNLPVGNSTSLQFTIKNIGDTDLSGIIITKDGEDVGDFTVTVDPASSIPGPSGSTTFTVQFLPLGGGNRTAMLHIASNDGDENPFDIELTGSAFYTLGVTYTTGSEVALTTTDFSATGSTVSLTLDHTPATGAELRVINNTGLDFIEGTFTGLNQGQEVTLTYGGVGYRFVANYYGGDGNDLVLVWARTALHAWGANILGQLGDGTTVDRSVTGPVKADGVLAGKTVIAVAAGYVHSVALCSDGTLVSWGFNIIGQLGTGTWDDSLEPVEVKVTGTALEGKTPVAIAAGAAHTLVLCSDGTVVAWGDNELGQLGDGIGYPSNEAVAVQVTGTPLEGRKVVGIAAGAGHSLARCSDGAVVGWGLNAFGQLGSGVEDEEDIVAFVPVAAATDGTALDGKQVKIITAGTYSSAALCTDGTLATWGDNTYGQLADGTRDPGYVPVQVVTAGTDLQGKTVTTISAGAAHVTALCSDGSIVSWGDNYFGQLADGTLGDEDGSAPVAALTSGTALNGRIIAGISAGSGFTIARTDDNRLIAWGSGIYGELGNNSYDDYAEAVFVATHTLEPEMRFTGAVTASMAAHTLATVALPAAREVVIINPSGNSLKNGSASLGFTVVVNTEGFRTLTLRNIGGTALENLEATITGANADKFEIVTPLSSDTLAADGTMELEIRFSPTELGLHYATLTLTSNDADEATFGIGLIGFSEEPPEPALVTSSLGDVITGAPVPDVDGITPVGRFDLLRRGGCLAENGTLAFPGSLFVEEGPPVVTADDSQGIWKHDGSDLRLIARTGSFLPDLPGAVFDYLPQVPAINDDGEVTLLASLRIGLGGITVSSDTGIWSELGGVEMSLLFLEGDPVFDDDSVEIGRFASGAYASAKTSPTTGEIAFSVTFRDAETDVLKLTDTAVMRGWVDEFNIYSEVVAREGTPAPGTSTGVNFGNLAGSYTDPIRMDPQGYLSFAALTQPGSKEGIWTQAIGGSLQKVFFAGDTAPGTSGATFYRLQRPSAGADGVIAFRAFLNADGDNSANTRNDGIWRGEASDPSSFQCILRRGDDDSVVAGLPAGTLVGNLWGGWLTKGNQGAWKGWLDVDGNGTSAAPTDKFAIYADTAGFMQLIVTVGDSVPGVSGATFAGFDLPVVGGHEQLAFLGNFTGGGSTSSDNEGLWRQESDGGPLLLVLRKGQTVTTSEGVKTIQKIDLPGSGQTDRRWEQPVMDEDGRLLVYVTFSDGSTSQLLVP